MLNLTDLIYKVHEGPFILLKMSEELKFIGHCLSNANETKSQNYQDVFALYETDYKRDGYFVEFGATDGFTISNTVLLEKKYNWSGILAEPNSHWHNDLFKNRSCHISKKCVYSVSDETVEFIASKSPDISGIKEFASNDEHAEKRNDGDIVYVQTISLVDLLESYSAPNEIDYLSIDTEGSEYHILKAFFDNPKNYNIHIITVEHNYVNEERERIFNLLTENGYQRKFMPFSRCDDFYVKVK